MTIFKLFVFFGRPRCYMNMMLLIITGFTFSACEPFSFPKKGLKLSDAVEQAKEEPDKQEVLKPKKELDEWDFQRSDVEMTVPQTALNFDDDYAYVDTSNVINGEREVIAIEGWRLGAVVGGGTMEKQFDAFGIFGLQLLFPSHPVCVNVGLQYIHTNFIDESSLSTGLENEMEIALDISGRYYFTPAHTFVGIFAQAGIRLG